jgi:hypothetical protein
LFAYANDQTLQELIDSTPTAPDTSLGELLDFFCFEKIPMTFEQAV